MQNGAATPLQDLLSAVVLAALATVAVFMSLRLEVPDALSTAPGLLPFVVGASLLAMSVALGLGALRAGALRELDAGVGRSVAAFMTKPEERRGALLLALVIAYVLLVAYLPVGVRLPVAGLALEISAYEIVSVVMIAAILKIYWRASMLRCALVAVAGVEILALAFRFGFHMIMPETY
jgi:hypothetical protein